MKRWSVRSGFVLALALAGMLVLGTSAAFAKSYEMTRVWIDAQVAPDGSMTVTEERTFDFDGDYTFAYWELDKGGSAGIEVLGVSGPEGEYARSEYNDIDPNRTPQTFTVVDYGYYVDVRPYFRAENTEHTITLRYRVLGAATRWQDTGELYWKFIGERWGLPAEDIRVHITLPGGVVRDDVKAWAHGPLTGDVIINDDATVDLILDKLPVETFVEARVVFPAEALADAQVLPESRLQTILDEEAKWAGEANRERLVSRILFWGALLIAGLLPPVALGFAFMYWLRHGKEYKTQFEGKYFRDLPSDMPPAQVSALMNMGAPSDTAFPATLMDLIDRGVLGIERTTVEDKVLFGLSSKQVETYRLIRKQGAEKGLAASEKRVLDLIFRDMAVADSVTMEELKDLAKTKSKADIWGSGVSLFKSKAAEEIEKRGLLEAKGNRAVGGFVALGVLTAMSGLLPVVFGGGGWTIAWSMVLGAAVIILGTQMKRRSPEAAELAAKYEGVKNYLKDFGRMDEKPPESVVLWRHFLTLAVVYGIADQVIKNLQLKVPEIMGDPMLGTWMWMTAPGANGMSPMSSLSQGVTSVASIASSHSSSASGGGGGFSGGGGGGGAG